MKKLPKWAKPTIIITLFVITLTILLFGRTLYDFSKTNVLATSEIIPNIYAKKTGSVNCFLIRGEEGYIMVDTGSNIVQTEKALSELGIMPEQITAILLTHSDSDHVAAVSLFTNADVYLSESEVQLIDGTTRRFWWGNNSLDREFTTINDNEVLQIAGYEILCIAVPGHTPGSMSFLFNNEYLFVGDAMGLINGKAGLFINVFNMDEEAQATSISKLAAVDAQYIFTSHHGYSDNLVFVFDEWE